MKWFNEETQAWGFGDIVARIATPIGAAIGHPCVDKATRQLKPGSKCAERKARMNGELTTPEKADK